MRLDIDGMVYKGQRMEDGGEAHRAFLATMQVLNGGKGNSVPGSLVWYDLVSAARAVMETEVSADIVDLTSTGFAQYISRCDEKSRDIRQNEVRKWLAANEALVAALAAVDKEKWG